MQLTENIYSGILITQIEYLMMTAWNTNFVSIFPLPLKLLLVHVSNLYCEHEFEIMKNLCNQFGRKFCYCLASKNKPCAISRM